MLGTTLFRLSLNVATTRVILLSGNTENGAETLINTFGGLVVGGNVVVGLVVFIILVTINFVVITKGAGRIAEVAARFTLDALPGKQMAIDALIKSRIDHETTAKKRRLEISKEADFAGIRMVRVSSFEDGTGILIHWLILLVGFAELFKMIWLSEMRCNDILF